MKTSETQPSAKQNQCLFREQSNHTLWVDQTLAWCMQITQGGDLVIRDVTWSKNMGLYKCLAHNLQGSDHIDTFLYPVSQLFTYNFLHLTLS